MSRKGTVYYLLMINGPPLSKGIQVSMLIMFHASEDQQDQMSNMSPSDKYCDKDNDHGGNSSNIGAENFSSSKGFENLPPVLFITNSHAVATGVHEFDNDEIDDPYESEEPTTFFKRIVMVVIVVHII
ncbi:hypothetical protein BX661DRAFT_195097 [Kickxella alabastrina]|uniref:uncharacterized protein n=1 Tax=Kickxella alabastrina TaxID=61397 RepID=UPI002220483E|nr:uncharacterized protein BX661DRAFT_195097 [Kickxella alabastrina]KAI7834454.1 hypothetical protein BX661DRAFT_195097 [Kickxella alabastrina]